MTWYAETDDLRRRQITADVAVALWVLLWLRIADRAGGVPGTGGGLRSPLDAAAGAGDALAGAGAAQQAAVDTLALLLALAIGGFPICGGCCAGAARPHTLTPESRRTDRCPSECAGPCMPPRGRENGVAGRRRRVILVL